MSVPQSRSKHVPDQLHLLRAIGAVCRALSWLFTPKSARNMDFQKSKMWTLQELRGKQPIAIFSLSPCCVCLLSLTTPSPFPLFLFLLFFLFRWFQIIKTRVTQTLSPKEKPWVHFTLWIFPLLPSLLPSGETRPQFTQWLLLLALLLFVNLWWIWWSDKRGICDQEHVCLFTASRQLVAALWTSNPSIFSVYQLTDFSFRYTKKQEPQSNIGGCLLFRLCVHLAAVAWDFAWPLETLDTLATTQDYMVILNLPR